MRIRFRHFYRNIGPIFTLFNIIVLAFFLYLIPFRVATASNASPTTIALAIIIPAAILLLPRLLLPLMIRHVGLIMRTIAALQYVVIGLIVLRQINAIPFDPTIAAAIYAIFILMLATSFWIMSDVRVLTERHHKYLQGH